MIYPKPFYENYPETTDGSANTVAEAFFGKRAYLYLPERVFRGGKARVMRELFKNFTGGTGSLKIVRKNFAENRAYLSFRPCENAGREICGEKVDRNRYSYALKISERGAAMSFANETEAEHAFFTLLQTIEIRSLKKGEEKFSMPVCEIFDKPAVAGMRALHICVFPESPFNKIRRTIRLAGFLKYTHIILEFWGTRRYRCFKEFGRRKQSYSKKQISVLARDIRNFGMEAIPMLNVFGHATENRVSLGKHTALDQDLKRGDLFDTSGWTWNLLNPEVRKLQKRMIDELIEIFGDGKYFHIGCDEAYTYGNDRAYVGKDKEQILIDHINAIAAHVKSRGRTAIMWADMLLSQEAIPYTDGTVINWVDGGKEKAERVLAGLDKSVILADWQYWTKDESLPTAAYLKEKGFEVIVCPWDDFKTAKICAANAAAQNYFGFMQTTWQTLFTQMATVPSGALLAWESAEKCNGVSDVDRCYIASLMRKLLRTKKYEDCGVSKYEIEV